MLTGHHWFKMRMNKCLPLSGVGRNKPYMLGVLFRMLSGLLYIHLMIVQVIYQRKPIHCLITRVWKQEKRRPKAELRRQKVINNTVSRSLLCPASSVTLGRLSTTLRGWSWTRWSGKLRLGHRFSCEMFRHPFWKWRVQREVKSQFYTAAELILTLSGSCFWRLPMLHGTTRRKSFPHFEKSKNLLNYTLPKT